MGLLPEIQSPVRGAAARRGKNKDDDGSSSDEEPVRPGGEDEADESLEEFIANGSVEYDASPEMARKLRKQKKTPEKVMHASLFSSIAEEERKGDKGGHFHRTTALVGEEAEKSYMQKRIVSNSSVMPIAPRESPKKPREIVPYSDGTHLVVRQECPHEQCSLMHSESHMARFFHACRFGALCPRRKDRDHIQFYTHPDPDHVMTGFNTTWERENHISPQCVPNLAAQRYQSHRPAYGYAPRGGFRPMLGYPEPPDLVEHHRRLRQIRMDRVYIVVRGLDPRWDSAEFHQIVRDAVGTVPVMAAYLSMEQGKATGEGIIETACHHDASVVFKAMHNKAPEHYTEAVLTLRYLESVINGERDERPSLVGERGYGLKLNGTKVGLDEMVDPGVRRYSRAIRACGPYYKDAEAVMSRMRDEGHKPDAACLVHLMRSYSEADPPQAAQAEKVMGQLREEGIPITATACNYIVQAWCKVGNMRRAELFVKEMEREKWPLIQYGPWRGKYLPLPNEETYHILVDAWERFGIMYDIAERQRGYQLDEEKCGKSVGGVVGSAQPAPSYVTAWARRRSGYMGPHNGNFVPKIDPDMGKAGYAYVQRNWLHRT